jgi:hypothetical protein
MELAIAPFVGVLIDAVLVDGVLGNKLKFS